MSNVIRLIERLGQDSAACRSTDTIALEPAEKSAIAPQVIDALKSGDQARLLLLLGARTNVFCAVFPAKQDEEDEGQKDGQDEDETDSPDDGSEKSLHKDFGRVNVAS